MRVEKVHSSIMEMPPLVHLKQMNVASRQDSLEEACSTSCFLWPFRLIGRFFAWLFCGSKQSLQDACFCGDIKGVKAAINRGESVDSEGSFGWTPLMHACQRGSFEIAKYLVCEKKANVNARDGEGQTPLYLAANHPALLQLLIENGACIDSTTSQGLTALHAAVLWDNVDSVRLLLLKGANVNAKCKREATPLIHAAIHGYNRVVKALVEARPDVNAQSKYKQSALHYAVYWGHVETVKELLSSPDLLIDNENGSGKSAFEFAKAKKHPQIVELLTKL